MAKLDPSEVPSGKPLIYVIAPYTAPTRTAVMRNIIRACEVGARINRTGLAWAVVPHQVGRDIEDSLSPLEWYGMTRDLMRRCDGAWVPYDSLTDGCRLEVDDCYERGLPVAFDVNGDDLIAFLRLLRGEA